MIKCVVISLHVLLPFISPSKVSLVDFPSFVENYNPLQRRVRHTKRIRGESCEGIDFELISYMTFQEQFVISMGNLLKRHGAIAFIDILATKTKWPAEIAPDFLKKIEALYKDLDDLYELNKNIGDVEKLKKELKKFKSYEVIEKLEIKRRQELSKEVLSCTVKSIL
jgi:hypothetical protein